MTWIRVDTDEDLRKLDESAYWRDSEGIEFYGTTRNEDFFPADVSRSGHLKKNIFLLCDCQHSSEGRYLELVFIDCDWYDGGFLDQPFFSGRVDRLKRVELWHDDKTIVMRCSRLIYRFLQEADVVMGTYYPTCWKQES